MSGLRDHETDLLGVLRRLEPKTPFAEALAQGRFGETVTLDPKALNVATQPRLDGVAVRAWAGDRWVEQAASGFDSRELGALVDGLTSRLARSVVHSEPPGPSATTVGSHDAPPARPMREAGTEASIAAVQEICRWGREVPDIKLVQARVSWEDEERLYLNTAGARCFQIVSRVSCGTAAVAMENGRSELNFDGSGGIGGEEIVRKVDEMRVRKVAEGARAMLRAVQPPAGMMNVVLDPGTAGTFAHESFGHGTEADQFVRNRSYLREHLGEVVGPEALTIVDDGSIPGAYGSVYFDDEGHPGQRTALIDRGRFVGALHDRESAAALGAKPTGNTRRSDFLSRAFVRMTNTLVEPADWSLEELLEEARDGVLLERWRSGMEDPAGGQMQLKAMRGHRIEGGRVTDLLGSMALSGKVLEFLRDIRGVGPRDHPEVDTGTCGKGHGDHLPVGGGGAYLLSRALVGPA
jgi:TldD protein